MAARLLSKVEWKKGKEEEEEEDRSIEINYLRMKRTNKATRMCCGAFLERTSFLARKSSELGYIYVRMCFWLLRQLKPPPAYEGASQEGGLPPT